MKRRRRRQTVFMPKYHPPGWPMKTALSRSYPFIPPASIARDQDDTTTTTSTTTTTPTAAIVVISNSQLVTYRSDALAGP